MPLDQSTAVLLAEAEVANVNGRKAITTLTLGEYGDEDGEQPARLTN